LATIAVYSVSRGALACGGASVIVRYFAGACNKSFARPAECRGFCATLGGGRSVSILVRAAWARNAVVIIGNSAAAGAEVEACRARRRRFGYTFGETGEGFEMTSPARDTRVVV